jgi:hypothetical protein
MADFPWGNIPDTWATVFSLFNYTSLAKRETIYLHCGKLLVVAAEVFVELNCAVCNGSANNGPCYEIRILTAGFLNVQNYWVVMPGRLVNILRRFET